MLGNKFGFFRSTSTPQMFLLFHKHGEGHTQRKPLDVQLGFLELFWNVWFYSTTNSFLILLHIFSSVIYTSDHLS